ncbi:MAG: amidohydrolase family protein [Acidobacteria bacterium]|nr:amidohydrolase family protein [Acidobacteriota bacterium]
MIEFWKTSRVATFTTALALFVVGCSAPEPQRHDVILRGGAVYDGGGAAPYVGDVAIDNDRIAAVGDLGNAVGTTEIDVSGLAVSPGFINMLSWATDSLIIDGRSQADIRQGVTLEIFGEGQSYGPLSPAQKQATLAGWIANAGGEEELRARLGMAASDALEVPWTTLGEYLDYLETKGVSPNVASFVGATTLRVHQVGYENRPPTDEELARMQELVREAMREGALGIGSSLIYAPAFYASTEELIALNAAAAEYEGVYISHMRSEGNRLLEAIDELITIAREAGVAAEIYHLKAAGQENWSKMDEAIARVEAARAEGLAITADMYNYTAGSTGLDAAMPPWVQEGGYRAWAERLQDPSIRARLRDEMTSPTDDWENLMLAAGAEGTLLVGFQNESLREQYTGMTLADVAEARGTSVADTAMDLVVEDGTRVQVVYFLMSEENIEKQIALPWVSFGSDAASMATEDPFTRTSTHPRAYGNFSRLLGRYVRERGVITLESAVRQLTSLPAGNLGLDARGMLAPGFFADVAIFDPSTIGDHATYEEPHQYSTGMVHVFVNGEQVLRDGEHTGALPGRVVRGRGWEGE